MARPTARRPKTVAGWPPRHCSLPAAKESRGDQACEFIEAYGRIVKDSVAGRAGERLTLRPWQRSLIGSLLVEDDSGLLLHRAALIGMARKNGKSAVGSGLALWSLLLGPDGGEVYSCAGSRDQARIVFGTTRRMVELDQELTANCKLYRDAIEVPSTGSVYRTLSREAGISEGLNPTFVIFDEVHVQPDSELWDVMSLAQGSREESILVGITTAGNRLDSHGRDSHCYKLYKYGCRVASGEVADPTFYFAWWEPKAGAQADHRDPEVWRESNPGYDDIVRAADFHSTVGRTSEAEFRTKRTNVWVVGSTAALPYGTFEKLSEPDRTVSPDVPVILMADGSWSGDSTGILRISIEAKPHVDVVDLWEREDGQVDWRVPVGDVEDVIRDQARQFRVLEVGMDPFRWQRSIQILENDGLPMLEYNMASPERMTKAWKSFLDAVMDQQFTTSGDPRLLRHVEAMTLKIDAKGARPVKDSRASGRHIDLGVCAVAGIERVFWHLENAPEVEAEWDVLIM